MHIEYRFLMPSLHAESPPHHLISIFLSFFFFYFFHFSVVKGFTLNPVPLNCIYLSFIHFVKTFNSTVCYIKLVTEWHLICNLHSLNFTVLHPEDHIADLTPPGPVTSDLHLWIYLLPLSSKPRDFEQCSMTQIYKNCIGKKNVC